MEDICAHSHAISKGTGQMAASAEDLEARSEQHASHMQQMIAARDQLALAVEAAVTRSVEAQTVAAQTRREAEASGQVVSEAVTAMGEIEQSAQQIGQIIGMIDEIAFQTNLLALNAGVEAARAGEAGRGFAVVAIEVRGLAQRAAESAKDIKALVMTSMRQVASGVRLVGETGKVLGRIQGGVTAIDESIGHIASAAQGQSDGLAEITEALQQMDEVTQQNTAIMESNTQAVRVLSRETDALTRTMGQFRLEPQKKAA
jgi:methyl-accepting chemotaxis protein